MTRKKTIPRFSSSRSGRHFRGMGVTKLAKHKPWLWVLAFSLWAPFAVAEVKIGYVNAARLLDDKPQAVAVS